MATNVSPDSALTYITHTFDVPPALMLNTTPMETTLTESLLTPGLQTTVRVHSTVDGVPVKNLDDYKGKIVSIDVDRPINTNYGAGRKLRVKQKVYRIGMLRNTAGRPGTRKLMDDRIEEYTIHACDPTILTDAQTLVAKAWKCTTPSSIVSEMLGCIKASAVDVEGSCCPRDYVARSIHPFQVISQQAEAALTGGSPSFLHYMTYEKLGTHKFRSLDSLVKQAAVAVFEYGQTGVAAGGYENPYNAMTYNFPCDFDLLSDLLNGIGVGGVDLSSILSFIPFLAQAGFGGSIPLSGCSKGTVLKIASTNSSQQLGCPDYSQYFALKRQARMGLLEQDKLALNIVVPWNPDLNAGKVIGLVLRNKNDGTLMNYGSGYYLVHTVTHNIKFGGMGTTTLDCVSTTVGQGGKV